MAKTRVQKESDLAELTEKLQGAKSVVISQYRGTSVKHIDQLRRALRKEQVFSKVYKISLIRKALEANGVSVSGIDYKQPVIVAISQEEETTPARIIKTLTKEIQTLGILGGMMDHALIQKEQVLALADLPSKQELRGQLVRTINAPVSGFVNVLAGNVRSLLNVLNAMAQKA